MRFLLPIALLVACGGNGKKKHHKTDDTPPDTDTSTTMTGTDVLQFEGAVPKNLIFISIDTFRKDHLGLYGDKGLTPFFDQIASEGVVLNDHQQCSNWTFGSTTCTLAGAYNIERGHIPRLNGNVTNRLPVPEGAPFLATWLGEAGFFSVIVTANDWLSETWGNTQGYTAESRPGGASAMVMQTAVEITTSALNGGLWDRWFMHMHHMEPHASYNPDESFLVGQDELEDWPTDLTNRNLHYQDRDNWPTMSIEDQILLEAHLRVLYEGEIRMVDSRIGQNWQELDEQGWLDDALVVIWNDHGEQFWEHGSQTHAFHLYGEESDGFAVFWAKNIVPGVYNKPTASIDLVPTILDLFELPIPAEVTGYPIGTAPPERPIFLEALARRGGVQAIVKDGYKLHYRWTGVVELFNRNVDPEEKNDIYDPADPKALELWGQLRPMIEDMAPLIVGGQPYPILPDGLP